MEKNESLTAVGGIRVGHFTDETARTGCTVVVLPETSVVSAEVRGSAPATREYALLAPGMSVESVDAIVLTGGSAFGLDSATGVVEGLRRQGRGFPTEAGPVPIVPAAALYDLGVGEVSYPTAAEGKLAFDRASAEPIRDGRIGAGTGATVGKWRGTSIASGLGSALVTAGAAKVAALVAVNAVGDAFSLDGTPLTGGPAVPGPLGVAPLVSENTTLAIVATDARISRAEQVRLLVRAHDAFGACLRPAHTSFDGDICYVVSVGAVEEPTHNLAEAAFCAVGRAIERAILSQLRATDLAITS